MRSDRGPNVAMRWHGLALAIAMVATWSTLHPWFTRGLMPAGDFAGYVQVLEFVRRMVLRYGHIPDWCPACFGGSSYLMSGFKEYLTLPLTLVLPPILAMKVMHAVLRVLEFMAMYAVFVRLFAAPRAGIVAAYTYGFSPTANFLIDYLDTPICATILPLVVLATVETARRPDWRAPACLGLLLALQLDTNYVHAMICPVLVLALVALHPWRLAPDAGVAPGWLARFGLGAGVFLLFGGSQLAWFALDRGNHVPHSPEWLALGRMRYSVHEPFSLLGRGALLSTWLQAHQPPGVAVVPTDALQLGRQYVGIVALTIETAGWFLVRRSPTLRRWYQAGLLVFLVQYGLATGPWSILAEVARTLGWDPGVDAVLGRLFAAVAAACVVGAVAAIARRWRRGVSPRVTPRVELLLGLAVVLTYVTRPLFEDVRSVLPFLGSLRSPGHFADLLPFSFSLVLGVALVAIERATGRYGNALMLAIGALVVLDFGPGNEMAGAGISPTAVDELSPAFAALDADETRRIAIVAQDWPPFGSLLAGRSNAGLASSWLDWQGGRYWSSYLAATDATRASRPGDAAKRVLADLARVQYVLGTPGVNQPDPTWRVRAASDGFALWERPDILPMALRHHGYLVAVGSADQAALALVPYAVRRGLVVVSGGATPSQVPSAILDRARLVVLLDGRRGTPDPGRILAKAGRRVVEVRTPPALWPPTDGDQPVALTYGRPAPERIVIEAREDGDEGMVFVSECYHPWWRATVDDAAAPVLRAQYAFMAVPIGPGPHEIVLRFQPPFVVAVADGATRLAWLAVMPTLGFGLAADARRRRRSAPAAAP